jgi:hypothetical protein
LFPSWSTLCCFAKNSSLQSLGWRTWKVIDSSTLAFSTKNEAKLMSDFVSRYQLSTIVFRRVLRHLIWLRCLWHEPIFSFLDCAWKRTWTHLEPTNSVKSVRSLAEDYKWRTVTSMYNFSKHGKHLINSTTVFKLRAFILIAKILTVLTTEVSVSTRSPWRGQAW